MVLAEDCYRVTKGFPRDEIYGMTSQMRRSAVSIAANIAEGYGRENRGSFVQFLRMAQGSLKELETHILLACRIGMLARDNETELLLRCEEIGKMTRSLIRTVQAKQAE
ncbi:four helix bundle protein [Mesorhizobium sp. B2-8-5]